MKPRNVAVLFTLLAVALFAALNWEVFSRPTTLNVVAGRIEATLGLLMLGLLGLVERRAPKLNRDRDERMGNRIGGSPLESSDRG